MVVADRVIRLIALESGFPRMRRDSEAHQDPAMVNVPMLSEFSVRLAFGLIAALALTPWRIVPLRFFRLQGQIALGVLVLAALSLATSAGASAGLWLLVASAVASYLASVSWGLGVPSIARVLDAHVLVLTGTWMVLASRNPDPGAWAWMAASRGVSGLLLGATLHSMLLGHYYLIAPAMTIAPLTGSLDVIVATLVARCVLAGVGTWVLHDRLVGSSWGGQAGDFAILAMRWGMGIIGAGVSVLLARRTAAIGSTQSATGILYVTTIFVLFGELATLAVDVRRRIG
jgi:hypothetical protein